MKKIISELTAKYGEKFSFEWVGNKVEIWSESYLFEYMPKNGKLVMLSGK